MKTKNTSVPRRAEHLQMDTRKRVVSISNLEAMCNRISGGCTLLCRGKREPNTRPDPLLES